MTDMPDECDDGDEPEDPDAWTDYCDDPAREDDEDD